MHRRENIGHGILNVCSALLRLSDMYPLIDFILPVHLNPAVSKDVKKLLQGKKNIHLLPPLPYIEFVALLSTCMLVITDSGGIQEESVSLGKAALVTRNLSERNEGVTGGLLEVVSTDPERILESARKILDEPIPDRKPLVNPYGEIGVSRRLVQEILKRYGKKCN
jgi:UDP-N-acetylglucosamine 2-epimerase (non-hydrolysing)